MFGIVLRKLKEAVIGVLPITVIIIAVNFTVGHMDPMAFASFLVGAALLVAGLALYSFGSGSSVEFMGGLIGSEVTRSRKPILILTVAALIGFIVTVAEPDLAVLANQVGGIDNFTLIICVAAGVSAFLMISVLRLFLKISLRWLLLVFYGAVFVLAFVIDGGFVPLAFDSSGVTTGPVTVPFIIALGAALSASLGGNDSVDSSFGIVGICSIGPIIAVMLLSLFSDLSVAGETAAAVPATFGEVISVYLSAFPKYLGEMAVALLPVTAFFIIYDLIAFKLSFKRFMRTMIGLVYVLLGLTLFLLGANVGFVPAGREIGEALVGAGGGLLITVGVIVGAVIVLAEPAVHVLTKNVEEITGGVIKRKTMLLFMCMSMAVSVGLSMMRIVFDIDIKWVLCVGYALALGLMFVVPKIFTGIAFDSGGVASGAMTAAFLLPMAYGATYALYGADNPEIGRYITADAFGCVSLVAMTPLVAVQLLGLIYKLRTARATKAKTQAFADMLAREGEVIVFDEKPAAPPAVRPAQSRRKPRKSR